VNKKLAISCSGLKHILTSGLLTYIATHSSGGIVPMAGKFCEGVESSLRTYIQSEDDEEDPIIDSSEEEDAKTSMMRTISSTNENSHLFRQEHLIRTLYKWAHLDKSIPACYKKSDDDISKKWGEKKLQTLVLKVSAKPKVSFAGKDDNIPEQEI